MARKAVNPARARPRKGGVIRRAEQGVEHLAEEIESRLLDAGQVATGTTSAEVNLAAAALEAIEGHAAPAGASPAEGPSARRSPARDLRAEARQKASHKKRSRP